MTSKVSESQRALNMGISVKTKYLGDVLVKELGLRSIVKLAEPIVELITALDFNELKEVKNDRESVVLMVSILQNPRFHTTVCLIASEATGRNFEDFDDLPITDWLRLANAFKEVTDWKELVDLFTKLLPLEKLQKEGKTRKGK